MNSKTQDKIFDELKAIEIPPKGLLVIKSDEINNEMINLIKTQLKEKYGFSGGIICLSPEDDVYFVGESSGIKVFESLINKVNRLENELGNLSRKVEDEHDHNLEISRGDDN